MLYKLTNFRFIVIKLFYINPALDIISVKAPIIVIANSSNQAILTYNLINSARVINKIKELATSTRAIRLIIEIPFYQHKENLKAFNIKKEEANLQLLL